MNRGFVSIGWSLGVFVRDVFENADDVAFTETKRPERRTFQIWKKSVVDFVTLEGGGIARAIINVTPSVKEKFEPIRWGLSCRRRAGRSGG